MGAKSQKPKRPSQPKASRTAQKRAVTKAESVAKVPAVRSAVMPAKATPMAHIHPVILSGGAGTRLWPLSRAMFPKQFIRFNGEPSSFLTETLGRLGEKAGFQRPILLCNNDHRFLVKA
ncbi:MAG: Xanthan biosynthesis protein xanB : Mannose-6-phosphate isomerase, partial [Pseudomonadota bacterium]